MDVSRRGCSSTSKVNVVPSRRVTSIGKISSAKAPLSMPATARWCERRAQASRSSRVRPASTAVFHPTVIDMSRLGASGVLRWVGDIHSSQSSVPGTRRMARGEVDEAWTPPATTMRSMSERIEPAAVATAARPEAQWRLWARPGTLSIPSSVAA